MISALYKLCELCERLSAPVMLQRQLVGRCGAGGTSENEVPCERDGKEGEGSFWAAEKEGCLCSTCSRLHRWETIPQRLC